MKHYVIGEVLENGEIEKGYTANGSIYKNSKAFYDKIDEICYIPEAEDEDFGYTYKDFLDITNGNEEVASMLFDSVSWEYPTTLLDEWLNDDEVNKCINCESIYKSHLVDSCPKCNQTKVLDTREVNEKNIVQYMYCVNDIEYYVTIYKRPLEKINWSWNNLSSIENEEVLVQVEDITTTNKTIISNNGDVKVINALTGEHTSYNGLAKLTTSNPKNILELGNVSIETHLNYFNAPSV